MGASSPYDDGKPVLGGEVEDAGGFFDRSRGEDEVGRRRSFDWIADSPNSFATVERRAVTPTPLLAAVCRNRSTATRLAAPCLD